MLSRVQEASCYYEAKSKLGHGSARLAVAQIVVLERSRAPRVDEVEPHQVQILGRARID